VSRDGKRFLFLRQQTLSTTPDLVVVVNWIEELKASLPSVGSTGDLHRSVSPALGDRQKISAGGGFRPTWLRNGRELFFTGLDSRQMFAVPVQSGTKLVAGRPQMLFEFPMFTIAGGRPYDVTHDGRFVIICSGQTETGGGTASNMIVVLNWFEELKRLVPVH
jgi:hypothetical protein